MSLNKIKVLLLITAMLAVTTGFPVSQGKEREERSVSDRNELPSQLCLPPYRYPFGTYPPFLYPWLSYFYPPIPVPASAPTPIPLNEQ
ncbi:uncharacterized protein LOC123612596 [Camelus bactrianus]|uniref:Uncharacterized protein LOC123612596 n=1 Tax=Camelus bactrianus TaxID=9837 RepID=A0AC58R926_CAMBA